MIFKSIFYKKLHRVRIRNIKGIKNTLQSVFLIPRCILYKFYLKMRIKQYGLV